MYDVGGKLMNGIKSMYVNSLVACVRVKGGEFEGFRNNSSMIQGSIMSSWLFKAYMNAVRKEMKMVMERMGVRFLEKGIE